MRFACRDPLAGNSEGPKHTWTGTIDPSRGFTIPHWEFTLPNGVAGVIVHDPNMDVSAFPIDIPEGSHVAEGPLETAKTPGAGPVTGHA